MADKKTYVCSFDSVGDKVIENIEKYPIEIATGISGISRSLYYHWRKEALDDIANDLETPKSIWWNRVLEAKCKRCAKLYDYVEKSDQWTAHMRLLESSMPQTFARNAYELRQMEEIKKAQDEMKEKIDKFTEENSSR